MRASLGLFVHLFISICSVHLIFHLLFFFAVKLRNLNICIANFFTSSFLFSLFMKILFQFLLLYQFFIRIKFLWCFKRFFNCLSWLLFYFSFEMVWVLHSLSTLGGCVCSPMLKWFYYHCLRQNLKLFLLTVNGLVWFFTRVVVSACIVKPRRDDWWIFYFWMESSNFAYFPFLLLPFLG